MMGALKTMRKQQQQTQQHSYGENGKLQAEMSGIKSSLPQTDKLKTDFNASHLHVGKVLVKAKDVNFHYPSLAASPMETTRPEAVKELWSSSLTFQLRSGDRLSLKGKTAVENNPAETHHGRTAPHRRSDGACRLHLRLSGPGILPRP